ncbi:TetR/AcrR family transcriptional regulator [Leucobacter sp.]
MSERETGGLRERKRRATQAAIERGALELALEHGYEHVTVEMICEYAMISPRTFFNYAGSKERAVLGIDPPLPGAERREAYARGLGGSPLEDLIGTLVEGLADLGGAGPDTLRKRHRILRENPSLAMKEFARMEEAQNSIVDLVRARLIGDGPSRAADPELDDEARMIVSLAMGVVHYLMRDWIAGGTAAGDGDAVRRAAALARRVAGG